MHLRRRFVVPAVGFPVVASLAVLVVAAAPERRADLPTLIPRELLFPKPAATQAFSLSPDGRFVSYLAPDDAGVQQLWLRDVAQNSARRLTSAPPPGVSSHVWAENNRTICYERVSDGVNSVIGLDVATAGERKLVAIEGARFGNFTARASVPDELLLTIRRADAREDDVYRLNLATGSLVLDTKNPGGVSGRDFVADGALRVRAAQRVTATGAAELIVRDDVSGPWRSFLTADSRYNIDLEAFSADDQALLVRSDLRADTTQLVSRRIRDGAERVIAGGRDVDIETVLLHPRTGAVQALSFLEDPRRWTTLDRTLAEDFRRLDRLRPGGNVGILSRDRRDARWIVSLSSDRTSRDVYLWDRATGQATLLLDEQPHLSKLPLAPVRPLVFTARDGLRVHGYLTLPVDVTPRGLPLVVWVHGGPYLRDSWGYDYTAQLFTNRGYGFLRVNFRGSRGFGRRFRTVAFKEWGGAMQHDIEDAVAFLVSSGVADRSRVGIIGHSYGGYVVLAALTMTPDLFACGAASSTVSNLVTFVDQFPRTADNMWVRETIGDTAIPADAAMLKARSPITHVDRLTKPLLIVRGDRDEAIPRGDLEGFASEIARRGREVTLVVYEGDGHFYRRENQLDYLARVEALFARCLGGVAEPMEGDRYPGSTGRIRAEGR